MSPGRLFDSPLVLVIIIVLALLLFGAPKLPGMARSLGQSMRIFKSEVKQMKDDPSPNKNTDQDTQDGEQPYEGRVVNSKDNHGYPSRHSNGSSGSTTEPPADRNA